MTPGHRAALGLVPDADQELRLKRRRAAHPGIVIVLLGSWPTAWVDAQKIGHPTLRGLPGEREEILPAERPASSSAGSPQESNFREP